MDLDFGISLDVAQRHTLYDSDEEDEVIEDTAGIFSVSSQAMLQELSKPTLLIAVGQTAAIFAKSYLFLEPEPLSVMTTSSQKVFKNRFFSEKATDEVLPVSELYIAGLKSPGNSFLVCIHEQPLNSEYCNLWSLKLFEHVHPEIVLILHSLPSHEHFSSHFHGDTSLLRSLQSSSWPHPCHTHFLEAPNTVKGEPAAALTHCQVYNMAASLVVLYVTSSQSVAECVTALQPVLQHTPLSDSVEIRPESEALQIVKKLLPKMRQDLSTLYT